MAETPASPPLHPPVLLSDSAAKDAMLTWFRGEFAAANAMIDALCAHLMQGSGGSAQYESVMAALHRRRLNWIPVLQMQKYHSISQVTLQLQQLAKGFHHVVKETCSIPDHHHDDDDDDDDSPSSDITDGGSREEDQTLSICCKHEDECESRGASLLKHSKRFSAKEHVRGHTASSSSSLPKQTIAFKNI